MIDQYSVYWVDLNPARGTEMKKKRPCVIISPPEMNNNLGTIIIAPVTSTAREDYPIRLKLTVDDITGWIVLDQIRAIDKRRLLKRIGVLGASEIVEVKTIIREMLVD